MTACTNNMLLKAMLQNEMDCRRSALSKRPSNFIEIPPQENDSWYVVATDGSTSIIRCKSSREVLQAKISRPAVDKEDENCLEVDAENMLDPTDEGVDLSKLDVEKETASKLIAGMNAITADLSDARSRAEITMPSTRTDLREIFKTDNVCMVSRPNKAT
jgi:hypothetical protein